MMYFALATAPGSSTAENEDWAGATPGVAVVLDGLSSAPDADSPCEHGTPWFVRQLGVQFLAAAQAHETSMQDALARAIGIVAAAHPECRATADGAPSATVAAIRVRPDDALEYLVLADARIVLEDNSGKIQVLTDERVDAVARDAQTEALNHPIGSFDQRRALTELINAQKPLRNRPEGYWVASGEPAAAHYAFTGCTQAHSVVHAVLLSDGASRIVDVFEQLEWNAAIEIMRSRGPAELIHLVREAEKIDPLGHCWPRYKTSDDATIVLATRG
jgi:hypothetical protein